ncbi:MAG TPA: beta-ketoacyl synthase N-terminal-like domain-containing protein [Candidatus Polarisedimenticolaceae bacterium]|nr:beta-ketoacyl synthase N-terminal-like domain-containing protein [Candidatus Polarisedimenticolaceae bacterium]
MTARPVVATGLGAVGPWGTDLAALSAGLSAGRPLAAPIGDGVAALVPDVDLSPWLPAASARRLGRPSRWAVAAARIALEHAGLKSFEGRRVAVVLATSFGAVLFTEKLVHQILIDGPESAQPFYFSECVANAAAAQVALALGATGANVTVTQREAGPLVALARGTAEVAEGRADLALVGSADEMTPLLHGVLERFRAIAREFPRPFDVGRSGALAGEGASILVLEPEADAATRKATWRVRITGTASAFDPSASESDWGGGDEPLARGVARTLARAGRGMDGIDRIVSGASGTLRGDRLEARVLSRARGSARPPAVVVPKAVTGEYGGGFLAAAFLAATGVAFGKITALSETEPGLDVVVHDGSPLPAPRAVLASALAAGGAGAWAVLERA